MALWADLTVARGQFWRAHERDDASDQPPAAWPRVVAVVPAWDEAESIAASIRSLLAQDYPGEFSIVLVDYEVAMTPLPLRARPPKPSVSRTEARHRYRLAAVLGLDWQKVWAQHQGITRADESDRATCC